MQLSFSDETWLGSAWRVVLYWHLFSPWLFTTRMISIRISWITHSGRQTWWRDRKELRDSFNKKFKLLPYGTTRRSPNNTGLIYLGSSPVFISKSPWDLRPTWLCRSTNRLRRSSPFRSWYLRYNFKRTQLV